jgi:hypothetical protein
MDLSTRYLGLTLAHPLIPRASPLPTDLDIVMRLEDAGAPGIGMPSLYALLEDGPGYLARLRDDLARWLDRHGHESVGEIRGCMSLAWSSAAGTFERGNYVRMLQAGAWPAVH